MTFKEKVLYWSYSNGVKYGIILILLPIVRDLIWRGAREWNMVSIGTVGVISQLIGFTIVLLAYIGGRWLNRQTKPK